MTTTKITLTITLILTIVTSMLGQVDKNLNKVWDLVTIEPLGAGMLSIGDEKKQLDLRNPTKVVLNDPKVPDPVTYKVVDNEMQLFDKDGKQLSEEVVWRIEKLTKDELVFVFLFRPINKELVRLKYKARD